MDCDQVFMILTSGPFPTGEAWDEEVETHLEKCGDCWQLAEALRPALEVFQEAVPPAEGRDLPGYWGDARPATTIVAQLSRAASTSILTSEATRPTKPRRFVDHPLEPEYSADAIRIFAITAAMTAAALAIISVLQG